MRNIEDFSIEEIENEITNLENQGYEYLQQWQMDFHVPDRIKLPNGEIIDDKELSKKLKSSPGDLILSRAQNLLNLYFAEGYEEERFSHYSFLNDEDKINAKKKYNPKSS